MDNADYDVAARDLCTHGDVRLTIGGHTIAPGDGHGEYGISEAALGLLRTLKSGSPDQTGRPFADRLIPHGCGAILMMGCPLGIDWTVRHVEDRVRITDVVRYDTTNEGDATRFPDLEIEMPLDEYRDEVVAFARRAKEPFKGVEKSFGDEVDEQDYLDFWEEYDRLLSGATQDGSESQLDR